MTLKAVHMTGEDMERIGALSAKFTEMVLKDRTHKGMGDIMVAFGVTIKCLWMLDQELQGLDEEQRHTILRQVNIGLQIPIGTTELPENSPHDVTMTVHKKH